MRPIVWVSTEDRIILKISNPGAIVKVYTVWESSWSNSLPCQGDVYIKHNYKVPSWAFLFARRLLSWELLRTNFQNTIANETVAMQVNATDA